MQPEQPNHQYDFIMNNGQKPKGGWLPSINASTMSHTARISILISAAVIIMVVVSAFLSSNKDKGTQPIVNLAAQAQEIARVSSVASQDSTDVNIDALASTVSTSLASQENQLTSYLTSTGHKVDPKSLAADQNKNTDSQFQAALQSNTLMSAYASYLRQNLGNYAAAISHEYSATSSTKLKTILNDAYSSVETILNSGLSS